MYIGEIRAWRLAHNLNNDYTKEQGRNRGCPATFFDPDSDQKNPERI
jgi:hypothetical protein